MSVGVTTDQKQNKPLNKKYRRLVILELDLGLKNKSEIIGLILINVQP
jgi:hypothetical protein